MKNDKLFALIRSMNKSEKRYFQLFSGISGDAKGKRYLQVFNAMQSLKRYDEKLLTKRLIDKGISIKNLSVEKHYLYNQILKALCQVNSIKSAKVEVRQYMDMAEVLFTKGLYEQALNFCHKALKTIDEYQIMGLRTDALLMERKVLGYLSNNEELLDNSERFRSSIQGLDEFLHQDELYRDSIRQLYKVGKVRNDEEATVFQSILKQLDTEKEQMGLHASIRRNQTLAAIHFSNNEVEKEYECMRNNLDLMDGHPKFKEEHIYEYVVFYSHILRMAKKIKEENYPLLLEEFLELGESIEASKPNIKARVFSLAYSTESVRLLELGDFERGVQLIPTIQGILKEYGDFIPRSVHMTFEYKFAYFHFGNGNLTRALAHINVVINDYSESDRNDVFRYAKIFSMIIHFELGNYALISYHTRSMMSYLKRRGILYPTEKDIIHCLKNLPKCKGEETRHKLLADTKEKILVHFEEDQREKNLLLFFDIIAWLESKITGQSFGDVKRDK